MVEKRFCPKVATSADQLREENLMNALKVKVAVVLHRNRELLGRSLKRNFKRKEGETRCSGEKREGREGKIGVKTGRVKSFESKSGFSTSVWTGKKGRVGRGPIRPGMPKRKRTAAWSNELVDSRDATVAILRGPRLSKPSALTNGERDKVRARITLTRETRSAE